MYKKLQFLKICKKLQFSTSTCLHLHTKPTFSCSKLTRMMDERDDINVVGLEPNSSYTLTSKTTIDSGHQFGCYAHYVSNEEGHISLSKDSSVGGMFDGIESMGWMWAMEPSPLNKRKYARFVKHHSQTPVNVSLGLEAGFNNDFARIFENERNVCETTVQKWYAAENVTKVRINNGKVNGTLYLPEGPPPFPAVISMYGGVLTAIEHEFRPALLASHGFVTLSLEYLAGIDSYITGINLELFEEAINFLINHKYVKSDRGIGVYGNSKGGSLGLAMAAYLQNIACVVSVNGSIYPDFASLHYKGNVICKGSPVDLSLFKEDSELKDVYDIRDSFMTPDDPESAPGVIEFYKQHDTAIMMTISMDDRNVNASYYGDKSEMLLDKYKHPRYAVMRYEEAGHLLEPPFAPLCEAGYTSFLNQILYFGGKPKPHCRAQELSWKRHLNFLNDNLL